MSFRNFNFITISPAKSVVVLCAGPSIIKNVGRIKQYIKKESSVVLSANYNYYKTMGVKSDYTYITDQLKLFENLSLITSDLIVPIKMKTDSLYTRRVNALLKRYRGDVRLYIERKKPRNMKVYHIGNKRKLSVYKQKELLTINSKGEFPYKRLGSAGQSCVLLSLVFKPKKILIVGLDGNVQGDISKKKMYDGRIVKYASQQKHNSVINYLRDILFPSMLKFNVEIETFEDVGFYGLDKKKLGVRVIK